MNLLLLFSPRVTTPPTTTKETGHREQESVAHTEGDISYETQALLFGPTKCHHI